MTVSTDQGFDEFLKAFLARVAERRIGEVDDARDAVPLNSRETAFTEVALETLEDQGQLSSIETAYFERKVGRANAKVNAYAVSEIDGRADLVVTIHPSDDEELHSVPAGEVATAVKKAVHVFRTAKDPFHEDMEPSSPAYDLMETLHRNHGGISNLHVIVLVSGNASKTPETEQPPGLPHVEVDVWDMERMFRVGASGLTYESLTIDLLELYGKPLPCLPAPKEADHRCYLAIFPGDLLADLYQRHGASLLELNVRSFLQARGKVNRGLRATLKDEPHRFLAYNNGISVTAEEVELVDSSETGGKGISRLTGMQIVNGGQTVASIHRAKTRDSSDLSRVQVHAKITEVESEMLGTLVPKISRYTNTQNKVNETDFSANHPYHVQIEKLSRNTWSPNQTSQWYYERARGQWEVQRSREGTTAARRKTFDGKYPKKQRFDKTFLAKANNAWEQLPHVLSLGVQKNFVHFMENRVQEGDDDWLPGDDDKNYRDLIAKVIILKRAETIARQIGFAAYRANAVCYTVALVSYKAGTAGGRVDLDDIWNTQDITENFTETLRDWMPQILKEIVQSAGDRNVTEWCKKPDCWKRIQSLQVEFAPGFQDEFRGIGGDLPDVGESGLKLGEDQRRDQERVMNYGHDELYRILKWARQDLRFTERALETLKKCVGYAAVGWEKVPSPRQTKRVARILKAWEANKAALTD